MTFLASPCSMSCHPFSRLDSCRPTSWLIFSHLSLSVCELQSATLTLQLIHQQEMVYLLGSSVLQPRFFTKHTCKNYSHDGQLLPVFPKVLVMAGLQLGIC